jgi:hypothetical protein
MRRLIRRATHGLYCGDTSEEDMNTEFTKQDLDLMFEAVEAWEREDRGPGIMGAMMGVMIGEKDSESRRKFDEDMKREQKKAEDDRRKRRERGCILRAKLITLRDQKEAEEFCKSV